MRSSKRALLTAFWDDSRTDEVQVGTTDAQLEWAMDFFDQNGDSIIGLNEE